MKDGNHFNKQGRESEEMTARWAVPAGREGKPSEKTENAAKYAAKNSRNAGFDRKEKKYSPDGERKGFDADRRESGFARGGDRFDRDDRKPGFGNHEDKYARGGDRKPGFGGREDKYTHGEKPGFARGEKYSFGGEGERPSFDRGGKPAYGHSDDRYDRHDDRGGKGAFGGREEKSFRGEGEKPGFGGKKDFGHGDRFGHSDERNNRFSGAGKYGYSDDRKPHYGHSDERFVRYDDRKPYHGHDDDRFVRHEGGFGYREDHRGFDHAEKYHGGEGERSAFAPREDRFDRADRKPGFVKSAVKPAPAKAEGEEPFWVKGSGARNASSTGDTQRLHKYMAMCGAASRRACEELIRQGKVTVNGTVITEMGVQVGPRDEVRLEGRLLRPETVKKYVIYHKPAGEVTTVNDPEGRACVLDHFRDYPVRLYPVGRLDYDSEGLLLLTNDGDLTERMLHPSHEVDKTYLARVTGDVTPESVQKLRSGILLDDHKTSPAKVRVIKRETFATVVLVTIHEGRYRQVRRMFEALEHKVLQLRRVEFGPLQLGDLSRGQWRELTNDEVRRLKASL